MTDRIPRWTSEDEINLWRRAARFASPVNHPDLAEPTPRPAPAPDFARPLSWGSAAVSRDEELARTEAPVPRRPGPSVRRRVARAMARDASHEHPNASG